MQCGILLLRTTMTQLRFFFLLLVLLCSLANHRCHAAVLENCAVLSLQYGIQLQWTVSGQYIQLQFAGASRGYLAIGFSADGTMTGGRGHFGDAYVASFSSSSTSVWSVEEGEPRSLVG